MSIKNRKPLPQKEQPAHFIQTERATHEAWALLTRTSPRAAELMHLLVANIGEYNAVIASQTVLSEMMGASVSTVRRAIATLEEGNWIEIRRVGPSSTACAYVLNDHVAWVKSRNNLRYSLFSAAVIVSETEQEDRESLGKLPPLRKLPRIGERQIPSGEGLPPVSEPSLPGYEPDLPAVGADEGEPE